VRDEAVRAVAGKGWELYVNLLDDLGQPASVSDNLPCVLTARLSPDDPDNVVVLQGSISAGVVHFSATPDDMDVAPGRYLCDVAVAGAMPANTEKFYLDVEEPVT
jgi:hypothetical protein